MTTSNRAIRAGLCFTTILVLGQAGSAAAPFNGPKTPLDEYVAKADTTYEWKVVKTVPGDGYTTFVVDLKSQRWRSPPEVDRGLWQHWLVVVKPDDGQARDGVSHHRRRAQRRAGSGRRQPKARRWPRRPIGRRRTPDGSEPAARPQRRRQAPVRGRPDCPRLGQVHGHRRPDLDPAAAMVKAAVRAMDTDHRASGERRRAGRWP